MNLILKNFKENLINKFDISPKIANTRAKKLEKILENNCLIEQFKNLDDLNEKITPKINEIINEEIEELKKERNFENPEIEYVSVCSEKKHIIDVYVKNENSYLLISFEIFARRENMSIEIFEVIKEKNIFSENFSVTLLDDSKKEITREYISVENSYTAFDTEKKENDFLLKNLVSENKIILNETEYKKLFLD